MIGSTSKNKYFIVLHENIAPILLTWSVDVTVHLQIKYLLLTPYFPFSFPISYISIPLIIFSTFWLYSILFLHYKEKHE